MEEQDPEKPGGEDRDRDAQTEREAERRKEDERYLPVILKRTDEALRHPDDILEKAIEEGLEQLERPLVSLVLSAAAAGLILGFTAMSVAVVEAGMAETMPPMLERLVTALVYPLGFVLCIMSATQLFTEHTATAVYPVLDRKAGFWKLLRLWGLVLAGNLAGALVSAWLLARADTVVQARIGYLAIASHLSAAEALPLLVSALLAGWLMALGAWLILATPPRLTQMASIYIVTFIIGLGGLHHSIAGAVELFTALLLGFEAGPGEVLRVLGLAVLGNLLGGSIFVALLNYGHIRQTRIPPE